MEKLIMNDGTELENSSVIISGSIMFVYITNGYNIKDAFDCLYNSEATKKIIHNWNGKEKEYIGYEKLISVKDEGMGLITAMLEKAQEVGR